MFLKDAAKNLEWKTADLQYQSTAVYTSSFFNHIPIQSTLAMGEKTSAIVENQNEDTKIGSF